MLRTGLKLLLTVWLVSLTGGASARAAATNPAPDFKEVYELLRSHMAGVTDEELDRAAVEGLLTSLRGKVSLIGEGAANERAGGALVGKSLVLEGDVAYVRFSRVEDGSAKEFAGRLVALGASNKLAGVVLDLRFAGGESFAEAAALADLFVAKERPLLDWGDGMMKSKAKENAIKLPAAVLVNRDTSGAAEALAAVLRDAGLGLILGGRTAGGAMVAKEFPLKNGQRLRIASSPVKLGDGSELSPRGLKPDIEVVVNAQEERAYLEDAYAVLAKPGSGGVVLASAAEGTNRPTRRPRVSEADLVREHRLGTNLGAEEFTAVRDREPAKPLIADPVLARAVDLLKGLAVVRQTRS